MVNSRRLPQGLNNFVTRRLLSRKDWLDIVEGIKDAGAGLQSLWEPWADSTSYAGRMVLTIFAGIKVGGE